MKDPENKITARSNEDYFQDIKEFNTKGQEKRVDIVSSTVLEK